MNINKLNRILLLGTLICALVGCRQTVDVKFDSSVADYTPVVKEILEAHPEGNITLRFGEGVYNFYPQKAVTEFLNVSNNDSGNKCVAFLLKNMKDVRIIGNKTDFMFHGAMMPIAVKGSENVEIEGVSIDYDYPWTFEAEVISNDPVNRSFVVKVFPDSKYRIEGDRLLFSGYDWEYPMGGEHCLRPFCT